MPAVKQLNEDVWSGPALRARLRRDGWRVRVPVRGREVWSHPQHLELVHLPEDVDHPVAPVALRAIYRIAGWDPEELEARPAAVSPDPKLKKEAFNTVKLTPPRPKTEPAPKAAKPTPPPRPEAYQPERAAQDEWYSIEPKLQPKPEPVVQERPREPTPDDILELVLYAQEHGDSAAADKDGRCSALQVQAWRREIERETAPPEPKPEASHNETPKTPPKVADDKREDASMRPAKNTSMADKVAIEVLSNKHTSLSAASIAAGAASTYFHLVRRNPEMIVDEALRARFDQFCAARYGEAPKQEAPKQEAPPAYRPARPRLVTPPEPQPQAAPPQETAPMDASTVWQDPQPTPRPEPVRTAPPHQSFDPARVQAAPQPMQRTDQSLREENLRLRTDNLRMREECLRMQQTIVQMTMDRYASRSDATLRQAAAGYLPAAHE